MIWCVEDDAGIRDIVVYALRSAGYDTVGFGSGDDFLEALKSEAPRLIVLDVMLPGIGGVDLLRQLKSRNETRNIPVVMATAKGSEYDKIESLDLGADYYIVKPFGMMELVSCVRAVLRRSGGGSPDSVLQHCDIVLNTAEHDVHVRGKEVLLTIKEYELLKQFMMAPGVLLPREDLFRHVWGTDFVGESRTLDAHIKTLRQKLGESGALIVTVRGLGYKLVKG